jgi:hypothetical protein
MNSLPLQKSKLDMLVAGSRWSYLGKRKKPIEIVEVRGIMVIYRRSNGKLNETTAQGFLYSYRLMEDVKL